MHGQAGRSTIKANGTQNSGLVNFDRPGISFTICANQFHLPENDREGLTGWLGKIEREFRLGIFRPEKQDYLFSCSVVPGHFPLEQPKKVMFHLLSNQIFRKRFVNGKQPLQISALVPTQAEGSAVNGRCTSCVSVLLLLSKNYLSHTDLMEL